MLNIWAILVGTAIYMVLGTLWYNKILFGEAWMKLLKLDPETLEMKPMDLVLSLVGNLLGVLFVALLLELGGTYTVLYGLGTGAIVAGILFTTSSSQVVYSGKSWKLFLIDTGYHAVSLLLVGILLGLWVVS